MSAGNVAPGAVATFDFILRAPATPGEYIINFSMLQEYVTWFTEPAEGTLWFKITVTQPIPAAPTNLQANPSRSAIPLTWQDNSNNETGFRIYRWRGEDLTWPKIGEVTGTTFTDSTVVDCTQGYGYRVTAFNSAGESSAASIDVKMPTCVPPGAPGIPTVTTTSSTATASWAAASGEVQGYHIYLWNDIVGSYSHYTTSSTTFVATDLWCEWGYTYEISAYNAYGESQRVKAPTSWTGSCPLNAPTNLHVTSTSSSAVNLAWDDSNSWEYGFNVYRWDGIKGIWERIGQTQANTTVFADLRFPCNMTTFYEVKAYRKDRESGSAGWISVKTEPCATATSTSTATATSTSTVTATSTSTTTTTSTITATATTETPSPSETPTTPPTSPAMTVNLPLVTK